MNLNLVSPVIIVCVCVCVSVCTLAEMNIYLLTEITAHTEIQD